MDSYFKMNRKGQDYFFVDSKENPIDSLESIFLFLEREDNLKWKWVIIALHHALYLFCIANLENFNANDVLSGASSPDKNNYYKRGEESWKKSVIVKSKNSPLYKIEWVYIDGEPPSKAPKKPKYKKLLGFWSAIARIQDGESFMGRLTISKPITLTDDEEKSIVWLAELRNDLMHFKPMSNGVEIEVVKQILRDILNVIERLVFETNQIGFYEEGSRERIKETLTNISKKL